MFSFRFHENIDTQHPTLSQCPESRGSSQVIISNVALYNRGMNHSACPDNGACRRRCRIPLASSNPPLLRRLFRPSEVTSPPPRRAGASAPRFPRRHPSLVRGATKTKCRNRLRRAKTAEQLVLLSISSPASTPGLLSSCLLPEETSPRSSGLAWLPPSRVKELLFLPPRDPVAEDVERSEARAPPGEAT